jgi:bacteriorhodopsin
MNIESAVSIVAGYVYSIFLTMIKEPGFELKEITHLRYIDWMITTPLLLLGIVLFYSGDDLTNYKIFGLIAALNWGMLYSGYLGETGKISKLAGFLLGFLFLFAVFYVFLCCIMGTGKSLVVFTIFAVIWSLYGVVYMIEDEETKNISYNTLDVFAKAIFGVILWLYFGKVLKF